MQPPSWAPFLQALETCGPGQVLREYLSFTGICPALSPSHALPSSEGDVHNSLGSQPAAFSVQFHMYSECLQCASLGPNVRGVERNQPYCQSSFQGPGHLWCQKCSGGKLCNQTKLARPIACPPGHYCPAPGLLTIPCPMVRRSPQPSWHLFTCAYKGSGATGPVPVVGVEDTPSL